MLSMIVVAAGQGERMGAGINKVRLPLAGEPLLCRCLERLHACKLIDEFILVAHDDDLDYWNDLQIQQRFPRLSSIVCGGDTRTASVSAGLSAVSPLADWVAIHDAARPLIRVEDLERLFAAREGALAAILALPVLDTLKRSEPGGKGQRIKETLPRDDLWLAQTPQLFAAGVLREAYACIPAGISFGDDAALVEAMGIPVQLVPGNPQNLKITLPEHLLLAEQIWASQEREDH